MTKSARGTLQNPGKNVKAKSGLNRVILDQGWGEFRRQLSYKSVWYGSKLLVVSEKYTSQTCSSCCHRDAANRQSQSVFQCIACGYQDNADTNAAKNIRTVGQTGIACGEWALASSKKQEPLRKRKPVAA